MKRRDKTPVRDAIYWRKRRAKLEAQREIDRANRPPVDPVEKQRLIDLHPKLTPGNKAAFDAIEEAGLES